MRVSAVVAACAVLAAVATGCGGSSGGSSGSSSGPTSVSVAAGKTVFEANCTSCHTLADAGSSGSVGPNLDQLKPTVSTVVHQVTNGGGVMPSFGRRLSKIQIDSVAAYVAHVAGKSG